MSDSWYKDEILSQEPEVIPFSSIDPSVHETPDQLKRRISGSKIKVSCIKDAEDGYIVEGTSGTYHTTLSYCTCFDYLNRSLPCKHMYRLAMDSGVLDAVPKIKPADARHFDAILDDEIARFTSYYNDGWISAEKYVRIVDALRKGR